MADIVQHGWEKYLYALQKYPLRTKVRSGIIDSENVLISFMPTYLRALVSIWSQRLSLLSNLSVSSILVQL